MFRYNTERINSAFAAYHGRFVKTIGKLPSINCDFYAWTGWREEYILCFDNDAAGQKAISRAMLDISTSFMVSYIKMPKKYKDVQDVRSEALLKEVIAKRHYW